MGRAKLKMDLIRDKKTRQKIFKKRKPGIFKKAKELSVLCGIPVLVIIYSQDNTCNKNHPPLVQCYGPEEELCPEDIISKYYNVSPESRQKNSYTVSHVLEDRNTRAEKDLARLRKETGSVKYPTDWDHRMDVFTVEQLRHVVGYLDVKIRNVKEKIDILKKMGSDSNNVHNLLLAAGAASHDDNAVLEPEFSTSTIATDHHQLQQGCYTYPSSNTGDEWIMKPAVEMFNPIPAAQSVQRQMPMTMPVQYYNYSLQPHYFQNSYDYSGQWTTMMMMMDGSPSTSSGFTLNSNNSVNSFVDCGQFMEPAGAGNINGWMPGFGGGGIEDVLLPCPRPSTSWQPLNINPTIQHEQHQQHDNFTIQMQNWTASDLDSQSQTVNCALDTFFS